jgi:hypothetical protein
MERGQNLRGVRKQVAGASDRHSAGIMKGLVKNKVRFDAPREKSARCQGIRVFRPREIN